MQTTIQSLVADRVIDRHAHDEQEKREDKIGGRATVPFGMFERWINMAPVTRVVDKDHGRYSEAAEKIQRYKAGRGGGVLGHIDKRVKFNQLPNMPSKIDWSLALRPLLKKYKGKKHPLQSHSVYQSIVMVVLSAQSTDVL